MGSPCKPDRQLEGKVCSLHQSSRSAGRSEGCRPRGAIRSSWTTPISVRETLDHKCATEAGDETWLQHGQRGEQTAMSASTTRDRTEPSARTWRCAKAI